MNKKILLFTATLGFAYLGITSYKAGPANSGVNRSGAGGTTASCGGSGCHAASSAKTTGTFALRVKSTGALVTNNKYFGGVAYTVTLGGTNTSLLTKFGFQIAATKADNTNAGNLVATATNTAVRTVTSIKIGEHTAALPAGTLPGVYTVTFDWTAPPVGSGPVTFYGIINAVNGTGDASGDEPSNPLTQVFNETTASINENASNIANKIFPNPCSNVLNIEANTSSKLMTTIFDLAGRQMIAPSHQTSIDVSALVPGVYVLRINTEEGQQTSTFVKQ
jgi:hypothetical protein